jgi:hypothetical protein
MADLQSRLGDRPPINAPTGPANKNLKRTARHKFRKVAGSAFHHNYSDAHSHHPNTNFSSTHLRRQGLRKPFNRYHSRARRTDSNSAHPDTPTNAVFATPNANVNSLTSTSSSPSSLLSRLSSGSTGGIDTHLYETRTAPSLMERIAIKVEDMEPEVFHPASEPPQTGVSTIDVENFRNETPTPTPSQTVTHSNLFGEKLTKPSLTNNPRGQAGMQVCYSSYILSKTSLDLSFLGHESY